jgi:hypothetical protein
MDYRQDVDDPVSRKVSFGSIQLSSYFSVSTGLTPNCLTPNIVSTGSLEGSGHPKQYPEEFRRDVTAVARKHEAPLSQVAHDFGVAEGYLYRWMRQVDVEEGVRESLTLVE